MNMSELKRCLDNAYDAIKHESYNDALSSILEAQERAKNLELSYSNATKDEWCDICSKPLVHCEC